MTALRAAARVALGALAGAVDGALAAMHPAEAVERAESYAELLAEVEATEEDTPFTGPYLLPGDRVAVKLADGSLRTDTLPVDPPRDRHPRPSAGWLNDLFEATAKFVADTTALTEAEALDYIKKGVDPGCGHQSCVEAAMGTCLGVHGAQADLLTYAHRAAVGLSMPPYRESFSAAGVAAEAGPAPVEAHLPGSPGAGHPDLAGVVDTPSPTGGDAGHYSALLRRAAAYATAEAWTRRDDRLYARQAGDDYYALLDLAAQFDADELPAP